MKLFINIASYRDELLGRTINDAYDNAKYKDSLVFGIIDQNYKDKAINPKEYRFSNQIRYIRVDPQYTLGCCWARSNAQMLWDGEEYYMQIDAHTIFDENWDETIINNFNELKQYHNRPIITGYPRGFIVTDQGEFIKNKCDQTHALVAREFYEDQPESLYLRFQAVIPGDGIVHGFLMAAGFQFTHGQIVEEVPYDPFFFFEGEEQAYTLRCWTHGYNFFHTPNDPIYHLYGTSHRVLSWADEEADRERIISWCHYNPRARNRLTYLMKGDLDGSYGLGRERTLEQYTRWTGINFANKTLVDGSTSVHHHVFSLNYKDQIVL